MLKNKKNAYKSGFNEFRDMWIKSIIKRTVVCLAALLVVAAAGVLVYNAVTPDTVYMVENRELRNPSTQEVIGLYSGEMNEDEAASGKGRLTLPDGTICEGEWADGNVKGELVCTFPNGSVYVGKLNQDFRPEGTGTFTYVNGEELSGEWSWGTDVEYTDKFGLDKIAYTGMMMDHQMTGYGVARGSDTHYYEGEFKNDLRYGTVRRVSEQEYIMTLIYDEGYLDEENVTFAFYLEDVPAVEGAYSHMDNEVVETGPYKGMTFRGHLMNGQLVKGTLTFENGSKYDGTFVDGLIYGSGSYTYADGEKVELTDVEWIEDQAVTSQNDTPGTYTGMLVSGKRKGYGTIVWEEGDTFAGDFDKGTFNGTGTSTDADGDVYTGEWKDGKRNGDGIVYCENGDVITGTFEDGSLINGTRTCVNGDVFEITANHGDGLYTGTFTFAKGGVFEGDIRFVGEHCLYTSADYFDSMTGTYTFRDGTCITGEFEWVRNQGIAYGLMDGLAEYEWTGMCWKVEPESQYIGYGTLCWEDGYLLNGLKQFTGEMKNLYPEYGEYKMDDGSTFVGTAVILNDRYCLN